MGEGENSLHKVPLQDLFARYNSSPKGLTTKQVEISREKYGKNRLTEKKGLPIIIRFFLQFKNFFSILLLVGAVLAFIAHGFNPESSSNIIAYALIGVTILNALFTFIQEYKAEQAMKSFKNLMPEKIIVLRDGDEIEINSKEVVPGDIIHLKEGDKIPADGRIIETHVLRVDHSMLTGESEPQLRALEPSSDKETMSRNMVFSGTLVQSGSGKFIVLKIGDSTNLGKIADLTTKVKAADSKIHTEIKHFVKRISSIALVLGIVFFILGFVVGRTHWESMVFAIGIIVANVPEGLLPTVTLTLSIAAKKMAKNNALVKDIEAIETLGGITTICTDKTGTLTQNKLSVTSLWFNGADYTYNTFHKTFCDEEDKHYLHVISDKKFSRTLDVLFLCNNSIVNKTSTAGDPTEIALKQIVHTQREASSYISYRREEELPFDAEKKYMIVATRNPNNDERIAHLKGSLEKVLEKSKTIFHNGKTTTLTSALRKELIEENIALAGQGKRILAIAYKKLGKLAATKAELEKEEYVFLGLIALQDPPRPEVAQAVEECYNAGINIIVISGDHPITVSAIAKQVGITNEKDKIVIMTSDNLEKISDHELRKILKTKNQKLIFARALPEDKLRIVNLLQELGEVVAVTGDGVNDAPALKQADVGVAMGVTGTDVAKEAANMVLLDDNFATIVKAIKRGRTVFDNIKKFIVYILTSNIPEILPFLFLVLFAWPLALPVLLILAIDIGTDMLPGISLGVEKSETDVMKQKPRPKNAKLLTKSMLIRSYGFVGPIQAATAFTVFFMTLFAGGWRFGDALAGSNPLYHSAVAAFFAAIIITQIFDLTSCRTFRGSVFHIKHFFKNKLMFIGITVELLLLAAIVFLPSLQKIFGTAPFNPLLIGVMISGGIVILGVEEFRKYLHRKHGLFKVA